MIYLPRYPTQNAAQWHPLTGVLLPGEVAPQTRRSKLVVIFMEIVRDYKARWIRKVMLHMLGNLVVKIQN